MRKKHKKVCRNSALYWNVYRMRTDPGFFFGKAEGEQSCRVLIRKRMMLAVLKEKHL